MSGEVGPLPVHFEGGEDPRLVGAWTLMQQLYAAEGWTEVGRGALAGPGEVGVVMVKPAAPTS